MIQEISPKRSESCNHWRRAVGCSVAYHLAKLGWTDIVPVRAQTVDRGQHGITPLV